LQNNTAGVREREEANRTTVARHLDEIQGVVAITLNLFRSGAVGFNWLGVIALSLHCKKQKRCTRGCKNRIIKWCFGT
jgi:hypothetical protein